MVFRGCELYCVIDVVVEVHAAAVGCLGRDAYLDVCIGWCSETTVNRAARW